MADEGLRGVESRRQDQGRASTRVPADRERRCWQVVPAPDQIGWPPVLRPDRR